MDDTSTPAEPQPRKRKSRNVKPKDQPSARRSAHNTGATNSDIDVCMRPVASPIDDANGIPLDPVFGNYPFGIDEIFDLFNDFFGSSTPVRFRAKNQKLADRAVEILEAEKPMTLRQLFYRVVSAGIMPNAPKEYKRLGAVMTRLREAGNVPRTWIVDHVRATLKPSSWSGLGDFGETVRRAYRKDFWASLDEYVEFFVEKDAIAGTIQPVTEEHDVALRVCRGYASVSFAGEIADEWAQIKKPIHAYYLGDFDPSGFDIERDLRGKLKRYSGKRFNWQRLAIIPADFDEFNLIALPVKRTDKRAAAFLGEHGTRCAEVDALPPNELRRRVRAAIERHIDADKWARLQRIEEVEKQTMQTVVNGWANLKPNLDSVSSEDTEE